MAIDKLVSTPDQAYSKIKKRLNDDFEPVWHNVNHSAYSPFWLLTRGLMPIAESLGDLIYKHDSTSKNLEKFIDNDLSKIRSIYRGKGELIAVLYRHSLMHQDEPRSLYVGNISIHWNIGFIDGRYHLQTQNKDPVKRTCMIQFDLRAFYEDLNAILDMYVVSGPRLGIVKRYNSWTFMNINSTTWSPARKASFKRMVKDIYNQSECL